MGNKKNKKVNPRRQPASKADVKKAKDQTLWQAIKLTKVLVFTAMLDLEFLKTSEEVNAAWDRANYLADSINKGYCSPQDMYDTLIDEHGVDLEEV